MSIFYKFFVLGVNLLIIMVVSCSCDEEPTKPPEPPPEEHLFYVGSYYDGHLKVFSVEQKKFVDSFYFPADPPGVRVEVIGKDEKLAVNADVVQIFDLKMRQTVQTYPDAVEAWVSPDSRYIALGNRWSDPYSYMLELRELESGNLIYKDSMVRMLRFSADSRLMAYLHTTQNPYSTELVVYDIASDSVIASRKKYFNGNELTIFFPLALNLLDKTFFLGTVGGIEALWVSEFNSDSSAMVRLLPPAYWCSYVSDQSEETIFVTTHPGWGGLPNRLIYIYDSRTHSIIDSMVTDSAYHEPEQLAVSWDGKYLVTGSAPLGSYSLGLTDLVNRVYLGSFDISEDPDSIWIPSWVSTRGK